MESFPKCGICHYFSSDTYYHCRRYPPTVVGGSRSTAFPEVQTDWWCGEYQGKMDLPTMPLHKGHGKRHK
jgi:hypothetical protein